MQDPDLDLLIIAAKKAGAIAQKYDFRKLKVWEKDDAAGPVTEADLEIDIMLSQYLTSARPDYGWLCEESTLDIPHYEKKCSFVIDPIDGTRDFIKGGINWSHSFSVVKNGKVSAAVVYVPQQGLLFSACLGGGPWLNGDRLQIKAPHKSGKFDLVATKLVEDDVIWKPNSKPPFNREHKPSIAFRMATVSQGRYHAMMTLRDSWEWDICAGSLLISESGGVVVDKYLTEPVFNTEKRKTKGIIAGTKEIVELVGSSLNL